VLSFLHYWTVLIISLSRFCPCHGSHYDICMSSCFFHLSITNKVQFIAGRARKGPAPVGIFSPSTGLILTLSCKLNLEIPPYDFNEAEGKLIVG